MSSATLTGSIQSAGGSTSNPVRATRSYDDIPGNSTPANLRVAFAAVGADEVRGIAPAVAVRAGDAHGDAAGVLVEAHYRAAPANIRVIFAGPLREDPDKPGCRNICESGASASSSGNAANIARGLWRGGPSAPDSARYRPR